MELYDKHFSILCIVLLFADDTKIIGNWFDLSSIQTDLNNATTWAAENRIDFNFEKFEQIRFQKSNKRYP